MMIKNLVNKGFLGFKPYEPGKPISEVSRELGFKHSAKIVKLASNENPLGPSPRAIRAMQKAASAMHCYPDGGTFYLRKKLAKKLHIRAAQLIFGNGSNEIMELLFNAFVRPGDHIVFSKHAFVVYALMSRLRGCRISAVPMMEHCHDLRAMGKAVTAKTKLLFVANPNNPTGTMNTMHEVEVLLKSLPKRVICVLDEAYYEYVTRKDYPKSMALIRKHSNLIVLRTFSKIYGLAGLRIGYGIAQEDLISFLHLARQPFNVNAMAQEAAMAALNDSVHLKRSLLLVKKEKKFLEQALDRLGLTYLPTQANFILIDVQRPSRDIFGQLLRRGMIVRAMTEYGYPTWIRVTIGTHHENTCFLRALKDVLRS